MLASSFLPTPKQIELGAMDSRFDDSTVSNSGGPDYEVPGPEVIDLKSNTGLEDMNEQATLLEIRSKRNKKRHRIPEKV